MNPGDIQGDRDQGDRQVVNKDLGDRQVATIFQAHNLLSDKMGEKGELYSCDQHHYILLTKFPQSHDWLAQKTST